MVLVQRVIYELVQLVRSDDQAVAQQAVVCLGEIGPVDLNTTALPTRVHSKDLRAAMEAYQDNAVMQRYCHLLHLLDSYLMDGRWDGEKDLNTVTMIVVQVVNNQSKFEIMFAHKVVLYFTLLWINDMSHGFGDLGQHWFR